MIGKKLNKRIMIIMTILILLVVIITIKIVSNKKEENNNIVEQNQAQEGKSGIYTEELDDGTKVNVSDNFKSKKVYGKLEITNIQFTEKNGMTVLLADVKNTADSNHEAEIVKITFIGENGESISVINPVIGEIKAGETIKLNASVTVDVADAIDFKIEEKNN